jgi:predicted Rossmann fold nucleotide-binding protein DprA/Smf involved in DNA uptake
MTNGIALENGEVHFQQFSETLSQDCRITAMLIGNGAYVGPNGEANIVAAVSQIASHLQQLKQESDNIENQLINKFNDYDESLLKMEEFKSKGTDLLNMQEVMNQDVVTNHDKLVRELNELHQQYTQTSSQLQLQLEDVVRT